jgi:hypothetical protein
VLKILVLISINLLPENAKSQILDSVYTTSLQKISLNDLKENKSFLVITNTNCVACIDYLQKVKLNLNILILTDNLSLTEIERLKNNYNINKKLMYFTKKEDFALVDYNGPQIIVNNEIIVNYKELSTLTEDFSLKNRKFKRKFFKTYN